MANNITALSEATNVVEWLGVFNAASGNWFVLLFILVGILLLTLWYSKQQLSTTRALLLSFATFFIPVLLLRAMDYNGVPLIGDSWLALHIVLLALFAVLDFAQQQ